ncbi:MAG TPA: phosphatase PAP2 family protein [Ramlibacter sp.]
MTTAHSGPRRRDALATLVLLAPVLLWDASHLDPALARLAGGPQGFPWREHWLLAAVLHGGGRVLAFAVATWLMLGIWRPTGPLRDVPRGAMVQWFASLLIAVLLVNALKHASRTSCPWDLADFGGTAAYVSHWTWAAGDGGRGHCFPAGHASAGFGFIGGFFALRAHSPRAARLCLWLSLAAGFLLGGAQQLRGAHFLSHTLWTGWLSWASAAALAALCTSRPASRPAGAAA